MLLARALDGLADVRRAQQDWSEAEGLYLRSAAMWESLLGPDQPRLATTLHNLGVVYLRQDKASEAEVALQRALALWERHPEVDLLLVAVAWPLNWLLPGLRTHLLFVPLWLGFCLVVDGLTVRRTGTSLLTRDKRRYAGLFVVSAPAWWLR